MMPAFIMIGSTIMPAIWSGWSSSSPRDRAKVVEADHQRQVA